MNSNRIKRKLRSKKLLLMPEMQLLLTKMEDVKPERVVLRAFGNEADYVRSLPIHPSQHEAAAGEDYTDFKYYVRPTLELCGHILSRGARLKVLAPQWLAQKVRQMLLDAAQNYDA